MPASFDNCRLPIKDHGPVIDTHLDIRVFQSPAASVLLQLIAKIIAATLKSSTKFIQVGIWDENPHCELQAPSPGHPNRGPSFLMQPVTEFLIPIRHWWICPVQITVGHRKSTTPSPEQN
jgi:hypothetical protein